MKEDTSLTKLNSDEDIDLYDDDTASTGDPVAYCLYKWGLVVIGNGTGKLQQPKLHQTHCHKSSCKMSYRVLVFEI